MERCRTIPEVYGFEVVLKQAIPLLPESLKDQRERFGRMALPENRVGKAVLPDSGSSPKNPQHHLPCRVCSEFTTTFSPRSSRCSQSVQRRNTSTSLAKRDRISVSGSGRSAFFFRPEPPLDCRSWLNQTGISLASGPLRSWWIRLELNPVDLFQNTSLIGQQPF